MEKETAPLFSIITVTYNAAGTIVPTLESVAAQSCRLFEYIVVDGASTDGTLDLLNAVSIPGMKVYSSPDKGIYDAMNKGLGYANGEYVIFLNAGDTFHSSGTLQLIADAVMDNDFPGIVYGQTDIVSGPERTRMGERHLRAPEELTLQSFSDGMVVCHQAFVVLRRITSLYNLKYRLSADYDWCIRCLQHSRHNVYIPEVIIDYLNEGMTTANRRKSLRERFSIMCYYYGTVPTVMRHMRFLTRFLRRRREERRFYDDLNNKE